MPSREERLARLDAELAARGIDPTWTPGGRSDAGAGHVAMFDRPSTPSFSDQIRGQLQNPERQELRRRAKRVVLDQHNVPDDPPGAEPLDYDHDWITP